ncbi:Disintegrin and metalloproteinase domain-containing protein 10 [Dirofilaria immitis]|nr:Disintegrin and metalloproteinase domain-containing protein 10 [Dirofilaria immitis]
MFVVSLLFISNILLVGGLSRFVDWYETLSYEPLAGRRKRSPDGLYAPLSLQFASHNRSFHLILHSLDDSANVFSDNFVFDVDGKDEHVPMRDFWCMAMIKLKPKVMKSPGECGSQFCLERRYLNLIIITKPILETDQDCGLDHAIQQKMEIMQNGVIIEDEENKQSYRDGAFDERACYVYLQADQKLYQHVYEKEGNMDDVRTREEIASLFTTISRQLIKFMKVRASVVSMALHLLYNESRFLYTPNTCKDGKPKGISQENPFCEENVDVSNYLNLNSRKNHSDFCLAYAFTFRDFVGGTLGLAWVASPNHNTAGGICQQYTKYSEASNFVYRSLNTGIITLVNYGNRVPNRVSQLTLAHEIGHNFGSPPGLPDGNYIMFASATSGDKKNNAQFSNCSIANITLVLTEVLQQRPIDSELDFRFGGFGNNAGTGKRNCFREAKSSFCGNQVKEPGEDCDCGYNTEDCQTMKDNCCNPRQSGPASRCKRIHSAQCSPSEGPCCDASSCQPYASRKTCRAESECLKQQQCNSTSPECPPSDPKENGLPCQDSTKVCNDGNCNGSVCAQVGLKDCFLTVGSPEHLCHLACEDENGTCRSTLILPQFAVGKYKQSGRANKPGLILLPGSPCNNYKGYCDIFRKCRSVDADGPLARLKNVIFNPKTLYEVKYWIQVNWWAVVLGGLGLLLFMTLFIKICAVHTPSTNPNKTPALNIYDTLRRPKTSFNENMAIGATISGRQTAGYSESNERVNNRAAFRPAASAPPLPTQPTSVLVIEPPPPYTASVPDSCVALGGPKRGHRRNRRRNDVEMRAKNRRN